MRMDEKFLVVRDAYETTSIPWSKISRIEWVRVGLEYRLLIAGNANQKHYPRAFRGVYWSEGARSRLVREISSARDAGSQDTGIKVERKRAPLTPEIVAVTIFIALCVATLIGQ
ncbi:hypothetical protein ACGFX2_30500 [Streptomyces goshikiensis]|uniref:hypothetical protein n=1 Tax=Streptomyces goshikiensis TaxID=1942 RepID=UPI003711B3FC